jgi:hypothetical protein
MVTCQAPRWEDFHSPSEEGQARWHLTCLGKQAEGLMGPQTRGSVLHTTRAHVTWAHVYIFYFICFIATVTVNGKVLTSHLLHSQTGFNLWAAGGEPGWPPQRHRSHSLHPAAVQAQRLFLPLLGQLLPTGVCFRAAGLQNMVISTPSQYLYYSVPGPTLKANVPSSSLAATLPVKFWAT